ncbi:helix-turn-helix domain-containing protein [Curvivirga sp.]|uniref:helix-turn-helix domain-containing protein n=1 Tax=Curvivirga sp. TaxID=2856848 RepID=UPI003B5BA83C
MNSINRHKVKRNTAIYDRSLKVSDLDEILNDDNCFGSKPAIKKKAEFQDKTIIRGSILNSNYKSGFRIHTTDIIEVRDYDVTATLGPAISIIIMLAGHISFARDGVETVLEANDGPKGYFISRNKHIEWTRHIKKDNLIRKVVVTMNHEFVTQDLDINVSAEKWQKIVDEPNPQMWRPSSKVLAIAERLIRPTEENPMVKNLAQQTAALEIITEALQHVLSEKEENLTSTDNVSKALRIKNYVDQNIEQDMSLDQLSVDLGVSVNSLQRYFKAEFNQPLMGYIRERKLLMAHEAMERDNLTIAQAAFLAGYNSAANFSTAYKKKFGFSPSLIRG